MTYKFQSECSLDHPRSRNLYVTMSDYVYKPLNRQFLSLTSLYIDAEHRRFHAVRTMSIILGMTRIVERPVWVDVSSLAMLMSKKPDLLHATLFKHHVPPENQARTNPSKTLRPQVWRNWILCNMPATDNAAGWSRSCGWNLPTNS